MRISKKAKFLLIAATCVAVAGWSGYRGERHAMAAAVAPKTTVRTMVKRLTTPAAKRAGVDRLEELRQAVGRKAPSRQETAALWAVVRGLSADEVKSALESLPQGTGLMINDGITDMLYYRWAQLEPEAAAAAALAEGENENGRRLIFSTILSAWAQRDPEAAIRWGRDSGNDMARRAAIHLAASRWVDDDPATAVSRARAEFPGAVDQVFDSLVSRLSDSPESRQQLYAILAKDVSARDAQRTFGSVLSDGLLNSLDGIAECADEMAAAGLPDEWIEIFRTLSTNRFGRKSNREILEQPPEAGSTLTAQGRQAAFRQWALLYGDEAGTWAAAHGEAGLVASTVENIADSLLKSDWTPGRESSASWTGSTRTTETVRTQFAVWKRMDAAAADAWLATMPGDIRKLVATTTTPEDDASR